VRGHGCPRRSGIGCSHGPGEVAGPQWPPPRPGRDRQGHRGHFPC
jgi:hypothetical protein